MVFILAETAAGYAIFKVKDKALKNRKTLADDLASVENATSILRLKTFSKFENTADALDNIAAVVEGKVSPKLASLLQDLDKSASLIVSDPKLGSSISQIPKLSFEIVADSSNLDLFRAIRTHLSSLIPDLVPSELRQMALGLSHSLSRHKLKFSPDKIDTMIVQAIALLDDLDKELNTYSMRVKEWFGWHFPEMGKIVTDNLAYAKVIKAMGFRTDAAETDFSEILPEDVSTSLKSAAEVSMGTEISQSDLDNIILLVDQILSLSEYRAQLYSYLCSRMRAIASNLTTMVGELVGARLIAHAGNLVNLAKQPASTIQILGAEKALFRALKTKHDTPKYGLIFHASLVGQASPKNKGKIARTLAAKTALALRYDALVGLTTRSGDSANVEIEDAEVESSLVGLKYREVVERRLRLVESRLDGTMPMRGAAKQEKKFEFKAMPAYNTDADVPMTETDLSPLLSKPSPSTAEEKKKKKGKKEVQDESKGKKKRSRTELEDEEDEIEKVVVERTESNGVHETHAAKKKKSKIAESHDGKKKKRKISEAAEAASQVVAEDDERSEKKRRKLEKKLQKKLAKEEARAAKKAARSGE